MTGKVRLYRGDLAVTTMAQVFFEIYRLIHLTNRDTPYGKVMLLNMTSPEIVYAIVTSSERVQNSTENKRNNLSFFVDPFTPDTILT